MGRSGHTVIHKYNNCTAKEPTDYSVDCHHLRAGKTGYNQGGLSCRNIPLNITPEEDYSH